MDILNLIESRRTIRKFLPKKIPRKCLDKVLTAAIWAPSLHNLQPWFFCVVSDKERRFEIADSIQDARDKLLTSAKILFGDTIKIMRNAPVLIFVYNTAVFSAKTKKLGGPYSCVGYISEIQSISAAIQNMCLSAHAQGLGSAWLTTPVLVKERIDKILKIEYELIAVLAMGYPFVDEKIKPRRKKNKEVIRLIGR